jgi:hypothetical protein
VKKQNKPSRTQLTILRQIVELIPSHLVPKLARETGVEGKARSFSSWSHVVSLLYAQLSHALSLNDVCDALRLWSTPLRALRGATPPTRNTLSHAGKVRDSSMAERLFWETLGHLQSCNNGFCQGSTSKRAWRFKRAIHIVDSTVIQLVASCMDWAKHRRRKAAAKCHMRLSLRNMLPGFALIDTAREHDNQRARELCASIKEGEIVLFDKAYCDFCHLRDLNERGVYFVTRAKDNMAYKVKKSLPCSATIIKDELVVLTGSTSSDAYPGILRRVSAEVELDGVVQVMVFLTNNPEWSASSVAELYRCRWQIEVFFKQIKQTLQLADFLGQSANAVKWQVWMALLVYVLLRFLAWRSNWAHSFCRLLTLLRAALWTKREVLELLRGCGTAQGEYRGLDGPLQRDLPGLNFDPVGQPL